MSKTSDVLFNYLRDIFYAPSNSVLDVEKLDEDYVMLGKGLMFFAQCFSQYNELARALAKGDLSIPLPSPENELAAPLKSLHASLRHLTWQSQQVAKGDYKQRVDFMGEFSNAFNTMIEQLAERQQKLENEIELSQKKTAALESSNQFLSSLMQYIPQQIFVIDMDDHNILLMNDMAKYEVTNNPDYFMNLMNVLPEHKEQNKSYTVEIQYAQGEKQRYLSVNFYFIEWNESNAAALVVNDISEEKNQIKELETHAYRDAMTQLYNRFYGMSMLSKWVDEKKQFALVFIDLDNLKYINDEYGHHEGDQYITNAAKHLKTFSQDVLVCRIGGDEFMMLGPDINYHDAMARMQDIFHRIHYDEYQKDKEYAYSISYGIVSVDEDNQLSQSDILSLADERMYEQKKMRKMNRQ